jgi:hypothetical protein
MTMGDNLIMRHTDFYINPTQEQLEELERELDMYLQKHLISAYTRKYILKKAKEYLEDISNES